MRVSIGVDVGTTGARAVAVDERGGVIDARTSEYPLLTPRPQWTEQDPAEWGRYGTLREDMHRLIDLASAGER